MHFGKAGDAVTPISICAVIPSHDHWKALPGIVARLQGAGLPVIIIDDGSSEPARQAIAALAGPDVLVRRKPVNMGKGAAVMDGFRLARELGHSHALQIDADGQHDLDAVPKLVSLARRHPDALICGAPIYDGSVPLGRRIGRWITHFWVFVETLSFRLTDSMCGLRVYPLDAVAALLDTVRVGQRMDFDTDIAVRLFWRGVPPLMLPVRVIYPPDNSSNFDVLRDNIRISTMHTRLFFTLLFNLRSILSRRPPSLGWERSHWAILAERGGVWGLRFLACVCRLLGRRVCVWAMAPIVFYFFATDPERRKSSNDYLRRVLDREPGWPDSFAHFMDFARKALDGFSAWAGSFPTTALTVSTPGELAAAIADKRGGVLVISHHGNVDLSRALMAPELRQRLTILVHTRHAEGYNRLMREWCPDAVMRTVQVTELGPDVAIDLKERVERGEWIAIAGDRIPVLSKDRVASVPFLGTAARFSEGPWLLAALLDCPVYLLFCRREGDTRWSLSLERFAEQIVLPRQGRKQALAEYAAAYARRLERECRAYPWQWYNFFSYWARGDEQ